MSWLEVKYITLLSNRLLRFKRKSPVLWTMRCILCGDSEKNQTKTRGNIYQRSGQFWYHCYNCSRSMPFPKFLKQVDIGLYNQYLIDLVMESKGQQVIPLDEVMASKGQQVSSSDGLKTLVSLNNLPRNHIARRYVEARQIPKDLYSGLYYCPEFKAWTNEQIPDKFEHLGMDEARLVIPFLDSAGNMFGYTGRSLNPKSQLRYVLIMLDENKPKVYGLDRADLSRRFYAVEGPIDAMFLKNAIATGGGLIMSELWNLKCDIDNAVVVFDNEPRNKDIVHNIQKAVRANFSVVIWPPYEIHKDINEMIIGGKTSVQIETILKTRTFKGLQAELEFQNWKH